jgi:hypothetical protein
MRKRKRMRGRKRPEKRTLAGERRNRRRGGGRRTVGCWKGKADGVWHTPHAIIME